MQRLAAARAQQDALRRAAEVGIFLPVNRRKQQILIKVFRPDLRLTLRFGWSTLQLTFLVKLGLLIGRSVNVAGEKKCIWRQCASFIVSKKGYRNEFGYDGNNKNKRL